METLILHRGFSKRPRKTYHEEMKVIGSTQLSADIDTGHVGALLKRQEECGAITEQYTWLDLGGSTR